MKNTPKTKDQLLQEIDRLKSEILKLEESKTKRESNKDKKGAKKQYNITNEENYRLIFEGASDGIIYVDKETRIININPAFSEITGIPREKAIGQTGFELAKKYISSDKLPGLLKFIKSFIANKPYKPYELSISGKILEISTNEQVNGYLVGIIRDISQRKQTEKALKESEERFQLMAKNAKDMIYRMSLPDGNYEYVSPSSVELFGYQPEEFYASPVLIKDTIHPDSKQYFEQKWNELIKGKMPESYEYKIIHKNGNHKWLNQQNVLIKNDSGQPIAIEAIVSDVTDTNFNQEALLKSERIFRLLFEQSADAKLIIKDNKFIDCNHAALKMLRCSSVKELINTHPSKFSPEFQSDGKRSSDKADEMMHVAYKNGNNRFEWLHQRKNGEIFPVEVLLTTISVKDEKLLNVVWRDITIRKKAEDALINSEKKYRDYFNKDISGVFLSTTEGKLIDFNPAFAKMFGYSSSEMKKLDTRNLYTHPSNRETLLKNLIKKRALNNLEIELVRKDGKIVRCIENVVGDFNEKGDLYQFRGYIMDVTENKLFEEALQEQVLYNDQILRTTIDGFILADTDGNIVEVNPSYCQMIGYSKEELLIMNISDIEVSLTKEEVEKRVKKMVAAGRDQFETQHKSKSGRKIDLSVSIVITQKKETTLVAAFVRNITQRKKAEKTLRESEQKLRNIFENSTNLFFSHTTENELTYLSPQVKDILGYTQEEALTKWTSLISNNPANMLGIELTQKAIDTGERQPTYEMELVKKGGEKIWVEVREAPIIKNGKTVSIVGALIDITRRIKAAKVLEDSEHLLRESQKISHLGSYILNITTGYWESSDELLEVFGIDKEYKSDFQGWVNIVHPDDRDMMSDYFQVNVLQDHERFNKEYRIIGQNDNREKWVHGIGRLEFNENGDPIKMIGTIQDITERKLINDALLESEAKYRSLIENSSDAIYLTYNNKYEVINNKFIELFGYTIDELNSSDFDFIKWVAPKSKQQMLDRQKHTESGELQAQKYEITVITKDGNELEAEISDSIIDYKDGKASQGIIRDITARKKQQEILMNAIIKVQEDEKYKFGKELHDGLGQVLTSTSLYLESLRKIKSTLPERKRTDLEQARQLNKQAMTDTRRISHGLMITGIDEHGIRHLIQQLCYNSSMPELSFNFTHYNIDENKISNETKVHIYRIVQEISTNILKHSKATQAIISMSMDDIGLLRLGVEDNGQGFNLEKAKRGAGLNNITQRITILKGIKEITTSPGNGTKIEIEIPI